MRGPNVTPGYWGLPRGDRAGDRQGRLVSHRRRGFFDEEGFLTISDRIKDMIITGGENVYPAEVESALMRHPAIAEVGVIGEPDEQWGEGDRRHRGAESRPGADARRIARIRGRVARALQAAGRLEIVPSLPRNATGKILKYQLRQMFAKPQGRPVALCSVRVLRGGMFHHQGHEEPRSRSTKRSSSGALQPECLTRATERSTIPSKASDGGMSRFST